MKQSISSTSERGITKHPRSIMWTPLWIFIGNLLCNLVSLPSGSSQLSTPDETFSQLRPYDISEELPLQSVVANVFADAGLDALRVNGARVSPDSWHFEILSATIPDLFRIDSPSGYLRVDGSIDRDAICFKKTNCSVHLDVQVSANLFIRLLRIVVNVLDINDNAPSFRPSNLVLNVSESTPPGTRLLLPTSADDLDSGSLGALRYDYSCNGTQLELVVGGSSSPVQGDEGELYLMVVRKLDREENEVYRMQVTAADQGTPSKSGLLDIIIFVEDSNDNSPRFDRDVYNVSIREDFPVGSPFVQVHAVDLDAGVNGQVVYSLARSSASAYGSVFQVDGATGEIRLSQTLDYRREHEYVLSVVAMDAGPSPVPAYARLVIGVIDVNDNAPTIKVSSDMQVPEDQAPGVLLGYASVDDPDSGRNGQVRCRIASHPGAFLLEKVYPKVYKITTNRTFDREEQETYRLTIECSDDGQPSRSAAGDITVRIADANDNAPVFTQDAYSVNVKESNAIGVALMRVAARDSDANENAEVVYSLGNDSYGLIAIDASTGTVSTAGVFDYEAKTRYEFVVTAADRGTPSPKSSTAVIVLSVVDFNDEAPIFLQSAYSFGTYENQPPGTEVGTVEAFDRDGAPFDRFAFSVVQSRPAANLFQVDANTGRIVSTRMLDREQYQVHYLVLAATNLSPPNPSSLVNVTISVADRNDNAPFIEFPGGSDNYTIELSADPGVGTVIARVVAHDADIGQNARLEYVIAKGNERDVFQLNAVTGELTAKRPLSDQRGGGGVAAAGVTRYSLVLVVRDFGEPEKSASAVLNVCVNRTTTARNWTKSSDGLSSQLFNANIEAIFTFEVVVILTSVMAALIIVLIITIVYIRRRNRAVVDRNMTKPASSRSPNLPKYLVRKPEVCNNEYTYCAAESVDAKNDMSSTLQLNPEHYKYDLVEDAERPRTHYTFAKPNNETDSSLQRSLAREPLLTNASHAIPANAVSTAVPKAKTSSPPTGDAEFRRLLEVLRRGESDSCERLSRTSTHSNLDSGRGPSETEIDHVQNSQNAVRSAQPSNDKLTND